MGTPPLKAHPELLLPGAAQRSVTQDMTVEVVAKCLPYLIFRSVIDSIRHDFAAAGIAVVGLRSCPAFLGVTVVRHLLIAMSATDMSSRFNKQASRCRSRIYCALLGSGSSTPCGIEWLLSALSRASRPTLPSSTGTGGAVAVAASAIPLQWCLNPVRTGSPIQGRIGSDRQKRSRRKNSKMGRGETYLVDS